MTRAPEFTTDGRRRDRNLVRKENLILDVLQEQRRYLSTSDVSIFAGLFSWEAIHRLQYLSQRGLIKKTKTGDKVWWSRVSTKEN